jgi:hypothetical protein
MLHGQLLDEGILAMHMCMFRVMGQVSLHFPILKTNEITHWTSPCSNHWPLTSPPIRFYWQGSSTLSEATLDSEVFQ